MPLVPMRTQSKNELTRQNAGDQVEIGVNFASDWLMEWHKFSGPITEQSKAKPKKSWITFDTQLKITLMILNAILVDIFFHRVQLRLHFLIHKI